MSATGSTFSGMQQYEFAAVAWVPWMGTADGDGENLAVDWLRRQNNPEDGAPVLRVHQDADVWRRREGPIGTLARLNSTTIVTDRGVGGAGGRPVLAPHASAKTLISAMSLARGSRLVVTEHPSLPLRAWAARVGAIDLTTSQVTSDETTDLQRELLDHVVATIYNGLLSAPGKHAVTATLPQLAASGMTLADFRGELLARAPQNWPVKQQQILLLQRRLPAEWQ